MRSLPYGKNEYGSHSTIVELGQALLLAMPYGIPTATVVCVSPFSVPVCPDLYSLAHVLAVCSLAGADNRYGKHHADRHGERISSHAIDRFLTLLRALVSRCIGATDSGVSRTTVLRRHT